MFGRISVSVGVVAAAVVFGAAQEAFAARLIEAEAFVDGKVVWSAAITARDREPTERVWRLMAREPFSSSAAFEAEPGAKTHTLKGKILLRIRHKDTVLAEAELEALALTRGPGGGKWWLSEAEMERAWGLRKR